MRKKYRLHKRHTMSALGIVIAVIAILIIMNTGYALWSSKLNIYGKVDLSLNPPKLDVTVPSTGSGRFTQHIGFSSDLGDWFEFVSDEYTEDSLVTTIRAYANSGLVSDTKDIGVNFMLKNTSSSGGSYTNGKITNLEVSNPGGAVSGISTGLSSSSINSGESSVFNFSANVNREKLRNSTYFKYAISYDDSGVRKYFFYTIRMLPVSE